MRHNQGAMLHLRNLCSLPAHCRFLGVFPSPTTPTTPVHPGALLPGGLVSPLTWAHALESPSWLVLCAITRALCYTFGICAPYLPNVAFRGSFLSLQRLVPVHYSGGWFHAPNLGPYATPLESPQPTAHRRFSGVFPSLTCLLTRVHHFRMG
jgi:hypothetical protein